MADLEAAEGTATEIADALATRASAERERRDVHESARAGLTALQLRDGRLASDLEAIERDRARLIDERATAEAEATAQRRAMVARCRPGTWTSRRRSPRPTGSSPRRSRNWPRCARRRRPVARSSRRCAGRRRPARPRRRRRGGAWPRPSAWRPRRRASPPRSRSARRRSRRAARRRARALEFALGAESTAATAREAARVALEAAEAERATAATRVEAMAAVAAALRARLDALDRTPRRRGAPADRARRAAHRRAPHRRGPRRRSGAACRRRGRPRRTGARVPRRRRPGRGPVGGARSTARRGAVVGGQPVRDASCRRCVDAAEAAGGGRLVDAIRRDPTGGARRLLARSLWLPDLAACLALQAILPPAGSRSRATARRSSMTSA